MNVDIVNQIKHRPGYETTDNEWFVYEHDAINHQLFLNFNQWYKIADNKLYSNATTVDSEDMMEWLRENRDELLELLNAMS